MISFPEEFLEDVDRIAREEHRSRSELLREAMRLYIATRQRTIRPGSDWHVQQAVNIQNRLSNIASGTGEDSAEDIRKWRDARSGLSEG
jgi:CopG family transcriptional regulator/antitoxin EndoAI